MHPDRVKALVRALLVAACLGWTAGSWAAAENSGDDPFSRFKTFAISDSAELRVNLVTGNLIYRATDLQVGGTGLDLNVTRYYESLNTTGGATQNPEWRLSLGNDVALAFSAEPAYSGSAAWIVMPAGNVVTLTYTGSVWAPPTHFNHLTLTAGPDGIYTLTDLGSKQKILFGGPGRRMSALDDAHGNRISIAYPSADYQAMTVTDTRGRVASVNLRSGITDWAGRSTTYSFASGGSLATSVDRGGIATTYGYDAARRLVSLTDPRGNIASLTYDAGGRVTSLTRGGVTWQFDYNAALSYCNSPTSPPLNPVIAGATIVWDPRDGGTRASNYKQVHCYGNDGLVYRIQGNQVASTIDYTYDPSYRTWVSAGWGPGNTTWRQLDGAGRTLRVTTPTGASTYYAYSDPANPYLPVSVTDPQGNWKYYGYDAAGNVVVHTDAVSWASQAYMAYTYNANGTLASSTDTAGSATTYNYDSQGQLTSIGPSGATQTEDFAYDTLSRATRGTDGKRQASAIAYDAMDRVTGASFADGAWVALGYDANGNNASRATAGGTSSGTTTWTFDAHNRLTAEIFPDGAVISYGYDAVGNLSSYTDAGGTVSYVRGKGDKVAQIIEPGNKVTKVDVVTFEGTLAPGVFHWHPPYPPRITFSNNASVQNTVDVSGRLIRTASYYNNGGIPGFMSDEGASRIVNYGYTVIDYDEFERMTERDTGLIQWMRSRSFTPGSAVPFSDNITYYSYDTRSRLTRATTYGVSYWNLVSDRSYSYDAAGNVSMVPSVGGGAFDANGNNVQPRSSHTANYNAQDQMSGLVFAVPGGGGITNGGSGFWGGVWSRIAGGVSADPCMPSTTGGEDECGGESSLETPIAYAGAGHSEPIQVGSSRYRNSQLLGVMSIVNPNGSTDYFTRNPDDGSLIALRRNGQSYYYLTDALGSTLALTSADGQTLATEYAYTPWGQSSITYGPYRPGYEQPVSPFQFAGELSVQTDDGGLGLYHIGARWYDPGTGRWLQPDPLRQPFSIDEVNRYSYAGNNPVNYTDPSGLSFLGDIGKKIRKGGAIIRIIGALFGAGNSTPPPPPPIPPPNTPGQSSPGGGSGGGAGGSGGSGGGSGGGSSNGGRPGPAPDPPRASGC